MTKGADLAALVGARICHDLISPIGAIGNGMELLALSGVPPSPELELIEDSLRNAMARVQFFRIAFGAAEAGQVVSRSEILDTLQGV
jgi:histidine phosphotransferase ChpT